MNHDADRDQVPPRRAAPQAPEDDQSKRLSRRSAVWLTTLSTVVALATGMFTLRDQVFPQQRPEAQASVSLYEASIADACDTLNDAEKLRERNEGRLEKRLRKAKHSTLAQRDALLDSAQQIVERSEHAFGQFRGHEPPDALRVAARDARIAWQRIIATLHGYIERLEGARDRADLVASVRTLRPLRPKVAGYRVDRASALTRLGGGRCRLDPPITTPTISLPATPHDSTPPIAPTPPGANPLAGPANPPKGRAAPAPARTELVTPPPGSPRPAPHPEPAKPTPGSAPGGAG